jgi:hypothetical protein
MRMKLLASAKEIVGGKDEMILEFIEGTIVTVTSSRDRVLQSHPKLKQIPFVFTVN